MSAKRSPPAGAGPRPAGQTYQAAGVDINAAEAAKQRIKRLAQATHRPGVIGEVGFFGGFFHVQGYRDPVLVSSTDSVGTKVIIARQMGILDTVGHDIVNHCINDIFVGGAEPLFFLDYLGLSKVIPEEVEQIVKGMAEACKAANVALLGGETAELPGLYTPGEFDVVGFIVGAVERDRIIDGSKIQVGDALLGIPSSGLHTNGYSLARRVLGTDRDPSVLRRHVPELGRTLGEALLVPHRPYYPLLKPALPCIRGMAHITGGGLPGNVPRVLPKGLAAQFDRSTWEAPPLFRYIQRAGGIDDAEMLKVFNMGIGLVVVTAPEDARKLIEIAPEALLIGLVVPDTGASRVILS